jgi:hypothetical protein
LPERLLLIAKGFGTRAAIRASMDPAAELADTLMDNLCNPRPVEHTYAVNRSDAMDFVKGTVTVKVPQ